MARKDIYANSFNLEASSDEPQDLPSKFLIYGVESFGKSSLAACAPSPIVLMVKPDDGMATLMRAGRIPRIPVFGGKPAASWIEVIGAILELGVKDHKFKTLIIDTLTAAEILATSHITDNAFGGSREKAGSYGGTKLDPHLQELATNMINALITLQERKGMAIILLAQAAVATMKNPEGEDYGIYAPHLSKRVWLPEFMRYVDACLFGTFLTYTREDANKKMKGIGGTERIIQTERAAAYQAKNRFGLPPTITCPEPSEDDLNPMQATWNELITNIQASRARAA